MFVDSRAFATRAHNHINSLIPIPVTVTYIGCQQSYLAGSMDSSIYSTDEERVDIVRSLLQAGSTYLTTSQLHSLEVAYLAATRNTESIIKDEGARKLRLKIMLLENENVDLHEQLALADERIDDLDQEADRLQTELDSAWQDLERQEVELRSQARESNSLKVNLYSFVYMVCANRRRRS